MNTIVGAGGVIANEVVKLLSAQKQSFRLVARNARPVPGAAEMISADLSDKDQTIRADRGQTPNSFGLVGCRKSMDI
jgi:predicted amino acid dehydrogenase